MKMSSIVKVGDECHIGFRDKVMHYLYRNIILLLLPPVI